MKADQKYTYSVRIVSLISYLYSYGENYAEAIRTWEDFQPENSVDSLTKNYVVSANKAIGFHDIGQKDSADFYILDMASVIKEIMNQNQGIDESLLQDSVIAQDREISFNTETELILTYSYYCHLAAVVGESVWKEFDNYIQSTDQKECIEKYRKRVQLEDAKNFFPLEVPNKLVNVLLNR